MTEQELTAKLAAIVDSQRSKWEQKGNKMVFTQENFVIKNPNFIVSNSKPINL